ncbi:MAG: hypothetical protein AAF532_05040 [Planctomycetota bacterium]
MEELLNAIDRFLGDPEFHDRLCADAEEFHQLLAESRGLYPDTLAVEDEAGFDRAVDRTAETSTVLLTSLREGDHEAARDALSRLGTLRQTAHARFSY